MHTTIRTPHPGRATRRAHARAAQRRRRHDRRTARLALRTGTLDD